MRTSGAVNTAKTAGYHGICWIPMAMPGAGSCREWDHAGSGIMPGVGSCRGRDHAGGGIAAHLVEFAHLSCSRVARPPPTS